MTTDNLINSTESSISEVYILAYDYIANIENIKYLKKIHVIGENCVHI